jgi:hypothetical protein
MQRRQFASLNDSGDGPLDPRAVEIYAWRVQQLERAGYSRSLAHELAENTEVDLHVACDRLVRGCPEPTARAILS